MDDLGQWPPPPPPLFADPEPDDQVISKKAFVAILVVLLVVVVAGAGGAVVLLKQQGAKAPVIDYPTAWDARIKPLADGVAKDRQLEFRHPVAVRFLAPAEFEKTLTKGEKELSAEDKKEVEQFTGLLRAFGLLAGGVDLREASKDAHTSGTLAYYSLEDKNITVRGTTLTPAIKATLVHELTHVLQDQNFDIGDRQEKLRKADDKGTSSDSQSSVLDAVIEGDASRMETLYRNTLPPQTRKQIQAEESKDQSDFTDEMAQKKVPKIVTTIMVAPYVLGEALVTAAAERGGNGAVDALLRDTPKHDTALMDPLRVLAADPKVAPVPAPKLGKGEKEFDSGELGSLTLFLMLAERLPLKDALAASDAWGEDSYVAFTRSGASCSRIDFRGASAAGTGRIGTALRAWAGSTASVSTVGKAVQLESCDPGKGAKIGQDASEKAVQLVAVRSALGIGILKAGAPVGAAACLAGKLAQTYSVAQLSDPKFGAKDAAVQRKVQELGLSCRQ